MNISKRKESIKKNIPGLETRVTLLKAPVVAPVVSGSDSSSENCGRWGFEEGSGGVKRVGRNEVQEVETRGWAG